MPTKKKTNTSRRFFAAQGVPFAIRIFEMRKDGAYRAMPLSILTKKERGRCEELIALMTRKADCKTSNCDLKSPNFPTAKSEQEVAEFIRAVESRHGSAVWWGWSHTPSRPPRKRRKD